MNDEILRALVSKVMGLADLAKQIEGQLKKLMEDMEEVRALKEQTISLQKQVEDLIQKESEVMGAILQATGKIDLPVEKVDRLQGMLENQIKMFGQPLDKTVRHQHIMGKAFWVLFGMLLISSGATTMTVWQWRRADQYTADQMRWRAVKMMTDPAVMKVVDQLESASEADPEGFAREIEAEEGRREDLTKNMLREQEARRRIDELQKERVKK